MQDDYSFRVDFPDVFSLVVLVTFVIDLQMSG